MSFEEGGVISLPVNAFALEERLRDVTPPRSPTLLDRIADGKAEQWEVMGITREEWEEDKRYVAESLPSFQRPKV
ncbi:MAG: hypothetical protein M1832_003783 [Thelocarpon impressellum]|nr:MAG: hypothetical protein M1832_003783 [Thelocarpon impressellum]